MYELARLVRFSINPFLREESSGYNSYASRPTGEGLSLFFELCVKLTGAVEPATGFMTNVLDIDEQVRKYIVPVFARHVRNYFRGGKHIGLLETAGLLKSARVQLADRFGPAKVSELSLALSPFRKITVDCEDSEMIHFCEKFEFAATHKLWNDSFSDERNFEIFGKCANPAGHGHNYIAEVTVKKPVNKGELCVGKFERVVDEEFIKVVDHKNLNLDVPHFAKAIPTVENIAAFAWERMVGKFGEAVLHCVTVWETDKTCCSYYGG